MFSKEVMVTATVMVLLYDRTFVSGTFREAWRRRWPLYLALAATWIPLGYLVIATGTESGMRGFGISVRWWQYALIQLRAIVLYLRLTFWPHPLVVDYGPVLTSGVVGIPPQALVVALLLTGTVVSLRRWPAVGFLGAWFWAILAPSSSVVPLVGQAMAEHRMYLPLAAVTALVVTTGYEGLGWAARHAGATKKQRRYVMYGLVGVSVVALAWLTVERNQDYRNEVALWSDTVAKQPDNARAHCNLGKALGGAGRMSEAMGHYEQALRLQPDFAEAHNNLGNALVTSGTAQEVIGHYERALRSKPDYAEAHCNLGLALARLGRLPEAMGEWEQALRIRPDYAEAHNNLGAALEQTGRLPEAMGHLEQTLRIKPDYAEAHYNLGLVLWQTGKVQEAIGHYEQALRINPDYAEAHYNLGLALARLGRLTEATGQWEWALRIKPDYAEAHYNLGIALEQAGRGQEALGHYEQALRTRPDFSEAQNGLARLRSVP
jgi:tetratricopeptide (TPR) repeat protein